MANTHQTIMTNKRRTKIVATLGPATSSYEQIKGIIESGVNVCRLNFSHGKHEDVKVLVETIRKIDSELGLHTSLLADLQGPKIRVGEMENNGVMLETGATIKMTSTKCVGNAERIYISYLEMPRDVKPGEFVLMDDGKLQLQVVETNQVDEVILKVIHGGILSSNKGVNLPNTKISQPCLTEKDLKDLDFALSLNIDI